MQDQIYAATRAAVIQLLADGLKPSWRAVRDIIGTGSSTDITRRIATVLSDIGQELQQPHRPAASHQLELTTSVSLAREATEALIERNELLASLQSEVESLGAQVEQLKEENRTKQASFSVMVDRLDRARAREESAVSETALLRERLQRLERQNAELEAQLDRLAI